MVQRTGVLGRFIDTPTPVSPHHCDGMASAWSATLERDPSEVSAATSAGPHKSRAIGRIWIMLIGPRRTFVMNAVLERACRYAMNQLRVGELLVHRPRP